MEYIEKLFSPSFIIQILQKEGLSLRKKSGQHFLINRDIASNILDSADLQSRDVVLEIGPGLGVLSFLMAGIVKKVIGVELDSGFYRLLVHKSDELGFRNILVLHRDFMGLDPVEIHPEVAPEKMVSNLPYTIGIKAIIKTLDEFETINTITTIVQKELAQRISCSPGVKNYSYVSVYLQYMSEVRVVKNNISPENFFPPPEVKSAIVSITRKRKAKSPANKLFKQVVGACFSNRRKSLINNLVHSSLPVRKDALREKVVVLFEDENIRAERLSVKDFEKLVHSIYPEMFC